MLRAMTAAGLAAAIRAGTRATQEMQLWISARKDAGSQWSPTRCRRQVTEATPFHNGEPGTLPAGVQDLGCVRAGWLLPGAKSRGTGLPSLHTPNLKG